MWSPFVAKMVCYEKTLFKNGNGAAISKVHRALVGEKRLPLAEHNVLVVFLIMMQLKPNPRQQF